MDSFCYLVLKHHGNIKLMSSSILFDGNCCIGYLNYDCLDTQSNVSSSTSDIVREARQQVERSIRMQLLPLYTLISCNFAYVLTQFYNWMQRRYSVFVMHQQKSTNAYSLPGLRQPSNLLERLFHGAVRAISCIPWRITIVFLESESIILQSHHCKFFNIHVYQLLLIVTFVTINDKLYIWSSFMHILDALNHWYIKSLS